MIRKETVGPFVLVAVLVTAPVGLGIVAPAYGQVPGPTPGSMASAEEEIVRFFFVTDVHTNLERLEEVIDSAHAIRPLLVIDGGDLVHDATEAEFRRVTRALSRLEIPWYGVRGNHDADLRGPFAFLPPVPPPLRVIEAGRVSLFLLDNHTGYLSDGLFEALEAELERRTGERIIILMHVPAVVGWMPAPARLRRYVPFRLAEPTMRSEAEVGRFLELTERAGVLAVLSGHTHFHSQRSIGGVQHIVAGTVGGLTPGLGIPHEYLDITLQGGELRIERVLIGSPPPRDPVRFVATAFRFYTRLNGRNHSEQGWSYIPSASVQVRAGWRGRGSLAAGVHQAVADVGFERTLGRSGGVGLTADGELAIGRRELLGGLTTGVKGRPLGDFNRNVFLSAGTTAAAGVSSGRAAAEVGVQIGSGIEWRSLTIEARHRRTTRHQSLSVILGRRY